MVVILSDGAHKLLFGDWSATKYKLDKGNGQYHILINLCLLCFLVTTVGCEKQWIYQSESKWDKEWKSGAWDYLDKVPVERSKIAVIGSVLVQLHSQTDSSILDVGCGEGAISDFLTPIQKQKYVGVDISKEAIATAKKRRNKLQFIHSIAHQYQPNSKFDVIIFSEMLYYVDAFKILTQYEAYLTTNGTVIISMYYTDNRTKNQYKKIFQTARSIFEKIDQIEMSGYTHSDGDPKKKEKVWFLIEVYRKRGVVNAITE